MCRTSSPDHGLVTDTVMLPWFVQSGFTSIVYVPLVGNVCVWRLKLLPDDHPEVSEPPSGFRNVTVVDPMVLPVRCTVACCPALPEKVALPFWPGTVNVRAAGESAIVTLAL
jgi:hypothetical protein